MKRSILFVVMMAVMMAASVNLTSCGGDDDASEKPAQTSLNGTWVNTTESNELAVALTFDSGNNVVAFIEGKWFFSTVECTASRMTLKGTQIRMENFNNFGSFTALDLNVRVTIGMDYELSNGLLVIRNITMSPSMGIGLLPSYGLRFDKVYDEGFSIIL